MRLNRNRIHSELAMSGEELINTVSSRAACRAAYRPGQFKKYWGTCADPITIPSFPWTPTIPRYWEMNSRVKVTARNMYWDLLEMSVTEEDNLDKSNWVSGYGDSGWSVEVADCDTHYGSFCIQVWEKGRRVGTCLSTNPYPTPGTYTNIKLATVLDVGWGRLAFMDINKEQVLHKLDVSFHQPVYTMFGVTPREVYFDITTRLYSGREISFTDVKRKLIAEALSSD